MTTFTLKNKQGEVTFEVDRELGAGGTGTVYLGKVGEEIAALKICHPDVVQQFENQWKTISEDQKNIPKHYAQYHHFGDVVVDGQTRKGVIMDYAGCDLFYAQKNLVSRASENVQKAFQYKVLHTILESLEDVHGKNRFHGDLRVSNICTGIDENYFQDGCEQASLEQALIDSRILLVDPDSEELLAQKSAIMNPNDLEAAGVNLFCNDHRSKLDKEKDIYGFIAVFAWMHYGNRDTTPRDFAEEHELKFSQNKNKKRHWPSFEDLRKVVSGKMGQNYFQLEQVDLSGTTHPIITRPLDRLRRNITAWQFETEPYIESNITPLFTLYKQCCGEAEPVEHAGQIEIDACTQLIIKNFSAAVTDIEAAYKKKKDNLYTTRFQQNAPKEIKEKKKKLSAYKEAVTALEKTGLNDLIKEAKSEHSQLKIEIDDDEAVWGKNNPHDLEVSLQCIYDGAKGKNIPALQTLVQQTVNDLGIVSFNS